MIFYNNRFLEDLSNYIDYIDYSSYTIQYPPPFLGINYFDKEKYEESFLDLKKKGVGLYIHIPFCETKCTFCRYFSVIDNKKQNFDKYVLYLIKEIDLYSNIFKKNNIKINSLYFGGGTPSYISSILLNKILSKIYKNFNFTNDLQFCFEANPSSLNLEKLKILKKYKCNRLTLGVQSLDKKVLNNVNRKQTKKEVIFSIIKSKEIGIDSINIDLMLGIKGQSLKSFLIDLKEIIKLRPDMIHLHPYIPTLRVIDNKNYNENKKLINIFEKIGKHILLSNGYKIIEGDAYGLSNTSRNKQLYDAMNLGKYIGLGVSSVGFIGKYRYINVNSLQEYYNLLNDNLYPIKFASKLDNIDNVIQYIIYNMRYGKVDIKKIKENFGVNVLEKFKNIIKILVNKGKLDIIGDYMFFKFSKPSDFTIYSKYFYKEEILNYYYENIWKKKNMI